jgi:hypothetical protein
LYEDRRLGGEPVLTVGEPKDFRMRIPDRMPRCVCFLYVYGAEAGPVKPDMGGTGFFVSVRGTTDRSLLHIYLVTAKHVVEKSREYEGLHMRYTDMHTHQPVDRKIVGDWKFHDDKSVDLAVVPFTVFRDTGDNALRIPFPLAIPAAFLTPEKRKEFAVGIGDELSIVGLFKDRPGTSKNIPIVRTGNIAAMPDEPIYDYKRKEDFDAYLVEVRSFRGLSGSPVFVSLATGRNEDGDLNERGYFLLLGIIRGHFEAAHRGSAEEEMMALNTGIAYVTPSTYLADMIASKPLADARLTAEQQNLVSDSIQTMDAGFGEGGADSERIERLKIDKPMDEAVKKMFGAGKPRRE